MVVDIDNGQKNIEMETKENLLRVYEKLSAEVDELYDKTRCRPTPKIRKTKLYVGLLSALAKHVNTLSVMVAELPDNEDPRSLLNDIDELVECIRSVIRLMRN